MKNVRSILRSPVHNEDEIMLSVKFDVLLCISIYRGMTAYSLSHVWQAVYDTCSSLGVGNTPGNLYPTHFHPLTICVPEGLMQLLEKVRGETLQ